MGTVDILIIGGGAAGIAAAKGAYDAGCRNLLLVDRGAALGGVLGQCTHRGFGNSQTGVEFAHALVQTLSHEASLSLNTTVLSLSREKTAMLSSEMDGLRTLSFRQLILASGCRELGMGSLLMGGTRPHGLYTAGEMQALMNLEEKLPDAPVVILGSGDLGLILANSLFEKGIPVTLVEKAERCGGMARNQKYVLSGEIPILCGETVVKLCGYPDLTGVELECGTLLPCKSLLLAVGLIPERSLLYSLGRPQWLTLCGNCRRVHPMVEAVVAEGLLAGKAAWKRLEKA